MRESRQAARQKVRSVTLMALSAWLVVTAAAADGVIEINQAGAMQGGVTAGDTAAGFPVTISEFGSYRLTGNLTVADAGTTAIEVTSGDVTIDLNGFIISGMTTCSGTPAVT